MLVKEALAIVGGLSEPSKMPGYAYGLPAKECAVGSKLRAVMGSTCSGCYALKNMYAFSSTQKAQYRRLATLADPRWVEAMATLINRRGPFFRWHDSGDVQSIEHLRMIVRVAELTPTVRHWLPTREYAIVKAYRSEYGDFPSNLVVRLSAHMINGPAPSGYGLPVSTVETVDGTYSGNHACPARSQGNSCGDCRACWTSDVQNVTYHKH